MWGGKNYVMFGPHPHLGMRDLDFVNKISLKSFPDMCAVAPV